MTDGDPRGAAALDRHRRRRGARGRHDRVRHRLPRHRPPDRGHDPRAPTAARWPRCGTGSPRPTSAPRSPASRTSSCSVGPQHRARPQLDRLHDRVADQLRLGRAAHDAPPRSRAAEVRPEVQRAYNDELTDDAGHGVGHRRLLELLHRPQRPQLPLWPTFTWPFRQRTRGFDEAAYSLDLAPRTETDPGNAARPRRSCGASPRSRSFREYDGPGKSFLPVATTNGGPKPPARLLVLRARWVPPGGKSTTGNPARARDSRGESRKKRTFLYGPAGGSSRVSSRSRSRSIRCITSSLMKPSLRSRTISERSASSTSRRRRW